MLNTSINFVKLTFTFGPRELIFRLFGSLLSRGHDCPANEVRRIKKPSGVRCSGRPLHPQKVFSEQLHFLLYNYNAVNHCRAADRQYATGIICRFNLDIASFFHSTNKPKQYNIEHFLFINKIVGQSQAKVYNLFIFLL